MSFSSSNCCQFLSGEISRRICRIWSGWISAHSLIGTMSPCSRNCGLVPEVMWRSEAPTSTMRLKSASIQAIVLRPLRRMGQGHRGPGGCAPSSAPPFTRPAEMLRVRERFGDTTGPAGRADRSIGQIAPDPEPIPWPPCRSLPGGPEPPAARPPGPSSRSSSTPAPRPSRGRRGPRRGPLARRPLLPRGPLTFGMELAPEGPGDLRLTLVNGEERRDAGLVQRDGDAISVEIPLSLAPGRDGDRRR